MFEKSIKNDCNNFCLYNIPLKFFLKRNWYLASIFCHGPINSSILTFPNINLKKTEFYMFFWKISEKGNNLYLLLMIFHRSSKSNSYLMLNFRGDAVNLPTSIFENINMTETVTNLFAAWKFKQKLLKKSLFALWGSVPTVVLTGSMYFKLQFKFKLQWECVCFKLNIYKCDLKPKKS